MLDAVRALAPEIASRAEEIEQGRRVPADLVDKLRSTGAFRALLPRHVGGEELSALEFVRVLEEVAKADGSAGWTVMIGADFPMILSKFPPDVVERIYADGPDTLARGAFAPKGVAVRTDGGYIVSGRWPLASGSYEFEWVVANCVVFGEAGPVMTDEGIPEMRTALFRPDQVEFMDNWDSVGLRGTMSEDFAVQEKFVPEGETGSLFGPSAWDTPLYRLPMRVGLGPTHSGVVLGIAQGALDDLGQLARTKRPAFNPMVRLAEDAVFRQRYGELVLRLEAVRALTYTVVDQVWQDVLDGREISPDLALRARGSVALTHTECVNLVNEAFTLAGSAALYRSSSLQRRWRDVRTAAQHAAASSEIYQLLGAVRAGEPVAPFLVY
jgi:alkylation response protein AidB-like acyl-CoA dehydrogenase